MYRYGYNSDAYQYGLSPVHEKSQAKRRLTMPKPPPKYPDVRRCLRPQRHTNVGGEEATPTAPASVRRNTAEASAHHPDVDSATEVGTSQMRKSLTEAHGMTPMHWWLRPFWDGEAETAGESKPHLCIAAPGGNEPPPPSPEPHTWSQVHRQRRGVTYE